MRRKQLAQFCKIGLVAALMTMGLPKIGKAQVNPDTTLGIETSIVNTGTVHGNPVQLIEGGATRGRNLFHSFSDFNVGLGESVYFASPINIENILSRVTGDSLSTIDGVLGVDGPANLFLLNPNGIIFGPEAQLDIAGSFTASTAGSFSFPDGSEFSAVAPDTFLLSVSVPLGLQLNTPANAQPNTQTNTQPIGNIASRGALETGNALTLSGNQLSLEGLLTAGSNLTLQAQDTVTIRDTLATAFIAQAGNDLTIQGNQGIDILALQHLSQTPFVSGGDISLISDGVISADAHFESGSGLQLLTLAGTPGNFVSLFDPIILANGDVLFGDYTGAALKVETTGSIQAGNILITGPDTTLTADGTGSDEDLLASSQAAILRAGVAQVTGVNVPQIAGGAVFLPSGVANQPPGSIVVNSIRTLTTDGSTAGPIILDAQGNIEITGSGGTLFGIPIGLGSFSLSSTGDSQAGGDISLSTATGDINIQNGLFSNSVSAAPSANSGKGGNISISSQSGDINVGSSIVAFSRSLSGDSGTGGDISVSTENEGNITIEGAIYAGSSADIGNAGRGGVVSISSGSGDITIQQRLDSSSTARGNGNTASGGNVFISSISGNITARQDILPGSVILGQGDSSNSGNITITTQHSGNIRMLGNLFAISLTPTGDAGNGGKITLSSENGNITTQRVASASYSQGAGDAGNGGVIAISSSGSGSITTQDALVSISSSLSSGIARNGGHISISSNLGAVRIASNVASNSLSSSDNSGNAGDVSISSISGDISTTGIFSAASFASAQTGSGSSGNGGKVSLTSDSGAIRVVGLISSNSSSTVGSGTSGNGETISIASDSGSISVLGAVSSGSYAGAGNSGNGANISISSHSGEIGIVGLLSSVSFSDSGDSNNGGNISISSDSGNITAQANLNTVLTSSLARSTTSDFIATFYPNLFQNTTAPQNIFASSSSVSGLGNSGNSGEISFSSVSGDINAAGILNAYSLSFSDASSSNSGNGGKTTLSTAGEINIGGDINTFSLSPSGSSGDGGGITVTTPNSIVTGNDSTLASFAITEGAGMTGTGGDIILTANDISDLSLFTISSAGDSGNVEIRAFEDDLIVENLSLTNSGQITVPIPFIAGRALTINLDNLGTSGNATIANTVGNITLNNVNVQSDANGNSPAGNVTITSPGTISFNNTQINSNANSTGAAGNILVEANQISLGEGTRLSAATSDTGIGGTITIQPNRNASQNASQNAGQNQPISTDSNRASATSFSLTLAENSLISASTTGSGNGGGLRLLAPEAITISGPGRLAVETSGPGRAGNATASARTLTFADGVVLSASTSGPGIAGDITFNISDALTIDGSTVESRTTPGSTGRGGSINVFNAGQTNLINGGSFSLNSEGQGAGGDFHFTGGSLTLDGSNITAVTRNSNGGNFTFNLSDYLLLRNGSLISTEAGTAGAGGNGGRIAINTPNGFVIAIPNENSDIRANAFEGDGGNVNITARNLLGIAFRPGLSDTPASDITSSSEFGNSGTVTIDELNPNNLEPEVDLPVETAPETVARGCRGQGAQTGSFVSTGRGGLPANPVDPLSVNSIWQDLAPIEALSDETILPSGNFTNPHKDIAIASNVPITEAQGWQRNTDGTVTLLAERAEPMTHLSQADMCGG